MRDGQRERRSAASALAPRPGDASAWACRAWARPWPRPCRTTAPRVAAGRGRAAQARGHATARSAPRRSRSDPQQDHQPNRPPRIVGYQVSNDGDRDPQQPGRGRPLPAGRRGRGRPNTVSRRELHRVRPRTRAETRALQAAFADARAQGRRAGQGRRPHDRPRPRASRRARPSRRRPTRWGGAR